MGGFEGADHINGKGDRLDLVRDTGHVDRCSEDYAKLTALGIKTVRESVGWRIAQPTKTSKLDLTRSISLAKAAREHDVQLIWTFMHYGTAEGVSILNDSFISEFVNYAVQVAEALTPLSVGPPVFNLINEISFLAWATSQTNEMQPYSKPKKGASEQGYQTKCRLVSAVLKAMAAIKTISPTARFLHVEPVLHIVSPVDRPDLEELTQEVRSHQWQTWELLRGSQEPELGGFPEALDLMGVNYYYNGQMEVTGKYLDWKLPDPRRAPFSELLKEVWNRYNRPLIISETGHFDADRSAWLNNILSETKRALELNIPIQGLCIYPVMDRPCWHEPTKIIRCGLLDLDRQQNLGYVKALRRGQKLLNLTGTRNEDADSIFSPTLELCLPTSSTSAH